MTKAEMFETRAVLGDEGVQENDCENCDEPLIFAMRDNSHEFSMGLFTVLKCLKFAEEKGSVPKLPDGWWLSLSRRYSPKI